MLAGWTVVLSALVYLCALFAVAHAGDTSGRALMGGRWRATIYALTLAVYCTSWTFFGSVGFASRSGLDFLAIYIGPILVIGFGHRFVSRIVRLAKAQNITSIADFVAARYGKSETVAGLVCVIAVVGAVPYIALQLKAVSSSLTVFLHAVDGGATVPVFGDAALLVAGVLAAFAVAFGTRHIDATEHQDGLVFAIAVESVVKLVAFLAVGLFVTFWMFGGLADIVAKTASAAGSGSMLARTSGPGGYLTLTLLSACAALLLPRQFHMSVVENRDPADVRRAGWMFPLYLVAINLFVIPLALAGEALFPAGSIDHDMTVLALPLEAHAGGMALIAFIGGLSAATAMVIVDSVALAIMISNDLVMPFVLRQRQLPGGGIGLARDRAAHRGDIGGFVLFVRRVAIVVVILLAYVYYRASGEAALAAIGLLSFAAVAQIAPAFVGGLLWRRGTALGASAGLIAGFLTWAYTLLLPSLDATDGSWSDLVAYGPLGLAALKPTALLGLDLPQLGHGVLWSLGLNTLCYIGFSMARPATTMERLQAEAFVAPQAWPIAQSFRPRRASVSFDDLRATVARYLGEAHTARSFQGFADHRGMPTAGPEAADIHAVRFAEHLLASAIGTASSRLVLSLLLRRGTVSTRAARKLLDDASAAIQYNRDVLQNALDHARQGITVLDRDLRLIAWNRAFADLYDLPADLVRVGVGLDALVAFNARRGSYGPGDPDALVAARLESFVQEAGPMRLKLHPRGTVIEIRSNHLPEGGLVTTYTDITDDVAAAEALERANETLERRVATRTGELTRLNEALSRAKAEAEDANLSKTRFLAAASHDILQPLNAARLYATALVERDRAGGHPALAENVDASLDAVEEILTALLDISRLDAGALKAELSTFRIDEILRQMQREFEPMARERGLALAFVASSLAVRSDRRLLRRLVQNLISNAIKYTPAGTVLVGCRRAGGGVRLEVWDTGLGIPASKQKLVFREFQRLEQGAKAARGLGLGLSIVERIARVLDHPVILRSIPGRGSTFAVALPIAAPVPAPSVRVRPLPAPSAPLAGLRVLAIDNEPAIVEGMRTLLAGWGCAVAIAASRAEAVVAVSEDGLRPDLVIADYHLDTGDGLEAVAALRRALGRDLPAILLTADRSPAVREAATGQDVHVLHKPLRPAALRALLAQWRATRMAAE